MTTPRERRATDAEDADKGPIDRPAAVPSGIRKGSGREEADSDEDTA